MLANYVLLRYRKRYVAFLESLQHLRYNKQCACCEKKKPNLLWQRLEGFEVLLCDKCRKKCIEHEVCAVPWITLEDVYAAKRKLEKEREQSRRANQEWRNKQSDSHY